MFGIADQYKRVANKQYGYMDNRTNVLWRKYWISKNKERDISRTLIIAITICCSANTKRKARFAYEFQEKINHLLFMDDLKLYAKSERGLDSLVQTVHVFSSDIGMEFGVKKCAMLVMRRGRLVRSEGIVLPDENEIRVIGENDSYKYLGVLEADQIKREEMKETLTMEYKRRVRKVLQSKLNGRNMVKAIKNMGSIIIKTLSAFCELDKKRTERDG